MSEISVEYGKAIYEIAEEEHKEQEYLSELCVIRTLFSENDQYSRLLSSPNLSKEERVELIEQSFGRGCNENVLSFLKIMVERGYADHICACINEFDTLYCRKHGISRAVCTSAVALTDEQRSALIGRLEDYSKNKVELKEKVDPSLIGGIKVELDGMLLEGSLRARLDRVRSDMKRTIL